MRRISKLLCFIIIVLNTYSITAQSAPITIDGLFDDWNASLTTYTDTSESLTGVDLLELQVTNDDEYLFIKMKANVEFDLTDDLVAQQIRLFIDTDNNASTGYDIQQGYGSELGIIFKDLLAHYNVVPYAELNLSSIKLRAAQYR